MRHEELFDAYQKELEWIKLRLLERNLEFYHEDAGDWKHAKEAVFHVYENLRHLCEDGAGYSSVLNPPKRRAPAYKDEHGKYRCVGVVSYRDESIPVYCDESGMNEFMVYQGHHIQFTSAGGETDWYYEVDYFKDKIGD